MYQIILTVHVIIAICLIGLVMIQQGKGASMGTAFGSGASQTVFGSRGTTSFLFRITALLAAMFFATSLGLGYLVSKPTQTKQDELGLPVSSQQAPVDTAKDLPIPD